MDPAENKNGVGANGDPRSTKQTSDDATSSDAQVAAALSHGIVSPRRTVVNTLTPPEHHEEPVAPAPVTSTYTPPTTTAQINESFAKTNAETLEKIAENAVKAPAEAPTPSAPTAPAAPAPAPAAPASGPVQASFATPRAAAPTSAPVASASAEPTAPAPAPVVPAAPAVAPAATPAPAPSQTASASAPVQSAAPAPMASMPPRDFPRDHADRGDIILGGGGKPKKKLSKNIKFGIIIGLVFVAVGIIIAAVFAVSKSRLAAVTKTFNDFSSYLNTVPVELIRESGMELSESDLQTLNQDWSIINLTESSFSTSIKETYFNNLNQYFADFLAAQANASVQSEESSELSTLLDQYQLLFPAVLGYASRDLIIDDLVTILVDSGTDEAQAYIDSRFPKSGESGEEAQMPLYAVINNYMSNYLSSELEMLAIYQSNGCIVDYSVNYACSADLSVTNLNFISASKNVNSYGQFLDNFSPVIIEALKNETNNLQKLVEAIYA